MDGIKGKKILVTGASGFLGTHVVKQLMDRGDCEVIAPSHYSFPLLHKDMVNEMFKCYVPDTVIHLAAVCGGIGANQAAPGKFFYENMLMGLNVMECARLWNVEKFVQVGTVCSYPKFCPTPFKEEDLWNGYPEETNAPYGIAKKALLTMAQAYRQQYDFNAIYLIPVNLYGPGDNFDPQTSHVIPALIKKCLDAVRNGDENIVLWGTGSASREFLYVQDAAEGIIKATELYDKPEPVNLGSGQERSILLLAFEIAFVTGFNGRFIYNTEKPDGQPRRSLDVSRAKEEFGFQASTPFFAGLKETVKWYEDTHLDKLV